MMIIMWTYGLKEYIILCCVVIFGAIVHATSQFKASRENNTDFTRVDFLILFIIACFSWLIFWLIAIIFFSNVIRIILASAIGSFTWLIGLNKVSKVLLDLVASTISRDLTNNNKQENGQN